LGARSADSYPSRRGLVGIKTVLLQAYVLFSVPLNVKLPIWVSCPMARCISMIRPIPLLNELTHLVPGA